MSMRDFMRDEGGQVIVDYVLTLAAVISVVSLMAVAFRRSLFALWATLSRDVSAACPGCPPDPAIRFQ